jgi:hypothetical protein
MPTRVQKPVLGPFPDGAPGQGGASSVQVNEPRRGKNPSRRILATSNSEINHGYKNLVEELFLSRIKIPYDRTPYVW